MTYLTIQNKKKIEIKYREILVKPWEQNMHLIFCDALSDDALTGLQCSTIILLYNFCKKIEEAPSRSEKRKMNQKPKPNHDFRPKKKKTSSLFI